MDFETKKETMARMKPGLITQKIHTFKIKWRLEPLGTLRIMGETIPLTKDGDIKCRHKSGSNVWSANGPDKD